MQNNQNQNENAMRNEPQVHNPSKHNTDEARELVGIVTGVRASNAELQAAHHRLTEALLTLDGIGGLEVKRVQAEAAGEFEPLDFDLGNKSARFAYRDGLGHHCVPYRVGSNGGEPYVALPLRYNAASAIFEGLGTDRLRWPTAGGRRPRRDATAIVLEVVMAFLKPEPR